MNKSVNLEQIDNGYILTVSSYPNYSDMEDFAPKMGTNRRIFVANIADASPVVAAFFAEAE